MSHVAIVSRLAARRNLDAASEQALVEQCRRRDYDAFSKIVDAYQARVFGFVRRMLRSEEEALDVTQEVFIKAFEALPSFDGRSSLRTWLFKIANNLCIDRARKRARRFEETSLEFEDNPGERPEFADTRFSPDLPVLNDELMTIVEQAIGTMSDKLRTVLLMHDQEDMGYEEIALAAAIPVGTVKSRLFLARAHLQQRVGAYLEAKD